MSDPMADEYPGATHRSIPMNSQKMKTPTLQPYHSREFYIQAGAVALTWGVYERLFNRLLDALVLATGDTSEPNWPVLDYKRRRRLCQRLIVRHFQLRPKLRAYLAKILDDSISIQAARNGILHGKSFTRFTAMPDATMKEELVVESRKGTSVPVSYTVGDLETIAHGIYHLGGRLNLTFRNPVQGLSSHDTEALEALLSRVPIETTMPESSAPPKPFQA